MSAGAYPKTQVGVVLLRNKEEEHTHTQDGGFPLGPPLLPPPPPKKEVPSRKDAPTAFPGAQRDSGFLEQ